MQEDSVLEKCHELKHFFGSGGLNAIYKCYSLETYVLHARH